MIDLIDFYVNWIDNVVVDELEIRMTDPVVDVCFAAGEEVVDNCHLVAFEHQAVD
jgi:hypothetical protein